MEMCKLIMRTTTVGLLFVYAGWAWAVVLASLYGFEYACSLWINFRDSMR